MSSADGDSGFMVAAFLACALSGAIVGALFTSLIWWLL